MNWHEDLSDAVADFYQVASLAKYPLEQGSLSLEFLPAPHKPPTRIPVGKAAVYCFCESDTWLKIGVAGPKSNARYISQHYNPNSANSTLAASLTKNGYAFGDMPVGDWMKANLNRANILIDADHPKELRLLLEAFLHLCLRPRFER